MWSVGRLVTRHEVIGGQVRAELGSDKLLQDLGQDGKVGDRTMMLHFERTAISFLGDGSDQSSLPGGRKNTGGERHIEEMGDERSKKINTLLEQTSVEGVDRRGLVRQTANQRGDTIQRDSKKGGK